MSFPHVPYKLLPSIKNILGTRHFFFIFTTFIFIAHFSWACGSLCEESFFNLSLCAFTYLSNNSMDFSQTFVSTSPMAQQAPDTIRHGYIPYSRKT